MFSLATELCVIMDQLKVSNYDLTCLGINACPPEDFKALIQLLITKICELNGITPESEKSSGCPDCVVSVAPCFVQGTQTTMQLVDYVQMIANRICSIIDQIGVINNQIISLDNRVTILENTPPPSFTLPSIPADCILAPGNYPIDQVLNALLNDDSLGYCTLLESTGTPSDITGAVLSQCIDDTSLSLASEADGDSPVQTFAQYYMGTWVNNTTLTTQPTVANAINNIWISICDMYNYLSNLDTGLTVQDTTTVNLTYTSGTLTAAVQDTGWINLNGFKFMSTNPNRPQCRRIGNEVHFRGYAVVPMGNVNSGGGGNINMSTDSDDYVPLQYGNTFNTVQSFNDDDSCKIVTYNSGVWAPGNVGIGFSFNLGNSVIPTGILAPAQTFDGGYTVGGGSRIIAFRTVRTTSGKDATLHTLGSLSISSTGVLFWGGPIFDESYASSSSGWEYSGIGRHLISNPIAGENVPTFTPVAPSNYNAASAGTYSPEITAVADTWAFSQNCGRADQMGGFIIRLDGMRAFINPCDAVIPTPNPCVAP
jgi:hypothetical protein